LWRLPFRYEDRSRFVPVRALRAGEKALVAGRVSVCALRRIRRLTLFEARIEDAAGDHLKVL
jgi:RecG-like helicase